MKNAVIGAVVVKDVTKDLTVVGNPAKEICS
jgi:serine acetyltransferase